MALTILRRAHGVAIVMPPGDVVRGHALAVRAPGDLCFYREGPPGSLERDLAIAELLGPPTAGAVVAADTVRYAAFARAGTLGVSLGALLERTHEDGGGALDDDAVLHVLGSVAHFGVSVHAAAGAPPTVDVDDVWCGWDGSVRVYASTRPPRSGIPWLDDRVRALGAGLVRAADDPNALLDAVHARGSVDGAPLLAGMLAHMFADERARDLEWYEEVMIEDLTEPVLNEEPLTTLQFHEHVHHVDDGHGPPLFVSDLYPAGLARSVADGMFATEYAAARGALTRVTAERAQVLCELLEPRRTVNPWRLPTQYEYERYAAGGGVGVPSIAGVHDLCRVWEWTATPRHGANLVRGGRWRDRPLLARVENESWEDRAMADVGFRAVRYVRDDDAPWEPRT